MFLKSLKLQEDAIRLEAELLLAALLSSPAQEVPDFQRAVRPLLAGRCVACHASCLAAARLTLHAGDGRTPARQYVPARNGAAKRYGSVCWAPDASLVACGAADGPPRGRVCPSC